MSKKTNFPYIILVAFILAINIGLIYFFIWKAPITYKPPLNNEMPKNYENVRGSYIVPAEEKKI